MTKRTLCLACILLLAFCATALAQDVFQVNYFRNANTRGAPDATVSIDNPGPSGGSLCSMIYVFLPDQQMSECCGCLNSPDDLFTLSVNNSDQQSADRYSHYRWGHQDCLVSSEFGRLQSLNPQPHSGFARLGNTHPEQDRVRVSDHRDGFLGCATRRHRASQS